MQAQIKELLKQIGDNAIPVMPHSSARLRQLCHNDDAPIHKLVNVIEQDPGLTNQLLRTCHANRKSGLQREIGSVQQALMLLGTQKVSSIVMKLPTINKNLNELSRQQLLRTYCRAYHAASQALRWAQQRRDMTPDEVFAATQLHFLGEIMLALYAPQKLLDCFKLRLEKNIASEEAQYIVLGYTLDQLSLAIAEHWQLPELIRQALHAENARFPRAYGIMLAVQLARGAAIDWYSEKTCRIQEQAAEWLNIPVDQVIIESHQHAVDIARIVHFEGVPQTAALLLMLPVKENKTSTEVSADEAVDDADICLMPRLNVLRDTLARLQQAVKEHKDTDEVIHIGLKGMHDGLGLNRVVYARLDTVDNMLKASAIIGADNDPIFNRFQVKLDQPHLFRLLIDKTQSVCINDTNRHQYWPMVPVEFQKLIGTNSFAAMSVFIKDRPVGIFYADRHTSACQLDDTSYQYFKKLCTTLAQAMGYTRQAH